MPSLHPNQAGHSGAALKLFWKPFPPSILKRKEQHLPDQIVAWIEFMGLETQRETQKVTFGGVKMQNVKLASHFYPSVAQTFRTIETLSP